MTDDDTADPLRVRCGAFFACIDTGFFVTGEQPLRLLAQHLISKGEDPARPLEIHRGSKISRTSLGHAGGMKL